MKKRKKENEKGKSREKEVMKNGGGGRKGRKRGRYSAKSLNTGSYLNV